MRTPEQALADAREDANRLRLHGHKAQADSNYFGGKYDPQLGTTAHSVWAVRWSRVAQEGRKAGGLPEVRRQRLGQDTAPFGRGPR